MKLVYLITILTFLLNCQTRELGFAEVSVEVDSENKVVTVTNIGENPVKFELSESTHFGIIDTDRISCQNFTPNLHPGDSKVVQYDDISYYSEDAEAFILFWLDCRALVKHFETLDF